MKNSNKYSKKPKITRLKAAENIELLDFLLQKMGGMSRNSIKSLLAHRQVFVNEKIITQYNYQLVENDNVTISSGRGNVELTHPQLTIIHEDAYIIVVEKKEGLLTVSTHKESNETTAFSILKNYVKKMSPRNQIFVVHRLDRETSGVLVFAKSSEIQHAMRENWQEIVTKRIYTALVEGKMEKSADTLVSWLTENEKSLKIYSSPVDNGGKMAVTRYRTIKYGENYSLLEIELETGRKNQIRVQLQNIGHPIAGDKKYGATTNLLGRIGLHAGILEFYHPATDEIVHFESPPPRSFYGKISR